MSRILAGKEAFLKASESRTLWGIEKKADCCMVFAPYRSVGIGCVVRLAEQPAFRELP